MNVPLTIFLKEFKQLGTHSQKIPLPNLKTHQSETLSSTEEEDFFAEIESLQEQAGACIAKSDLETEPASYQEAMTNPNRSRWEEAMQEEMNSLI
jgi:hypothetical protein